MNVNMIRELAVQHKALKEFHSRCNQGGATLTITTTCPDRSETLDSSTAALIMTEIRQALLVRIGESEETIRRAAHG